MKFFAAVAFLCASGVSGFVAPSGAKQSTALHMTPEEGMKRAAVSLVAAAFLASNLAVVEPAFAVDDMDFGSSQVVAARSGGRAGGRSSAARAPSDRALSFKGPMSNPPPVIVAPPIYGGYGYGYNPLPGLGLSIGLNTMNQIGNDMRDYRQEGEIQRTRAELENSRQREAEMEARLRQLEMAAQNQQLSQQQIMQLQMLQQQAKAQPAQ
eukprot:CAMPEP_0176239252 /NCGR_PEP_ID=MMETSP0121_2-20121125/28777_1 /TAXON_ID=160619 /ORGANISM="Kryptoperidinium foliaceum, Strain CCMP 1326" /LENGTH=209 /DNA_ID=CAMNT_0017578737 /DNA_START=88 /DNA_END=716 /DNA_ORIENTATION=+